MRTWSANWEVAAPLEERSQPLFQAGDRTTKQLKHISRTVTVQCDQRHTTEPSMPVPITLDIHPESQLVHVAQPDDMNVTN